MLDFESISFVISPEAAKVFRIPVVKRSKPVNSKDVTGRIMETEGRLMLPLGLSFGNHRFFNKEDHAFKVMKTKGDYDALIPL